VTHYAFKFLAHGGVGPVSEYPWPAPAPQAGQPGAWVQAASALEACRSGVHACGADELAHWLHDELWIVELAGEIVPGIDCVVAQRGRLLRKVDAWSQGGAARFATAARDHAAELVATASEPARARLTQYVADSSWHLPHGSTALAAFCAAMAVAWLGGGSRFDDATYRSERVWQSRFIVGDLELEAALTR
jgi:hypothetical protein